MTTTNTFVIRTDTKATNVGSNLVAACTKQISGVVCIPVRYVMKVGKDRWGYYIRAKVVYRWLNNSRQPHVINEHNRQFPKNKIGVPQEQDVTRKFFYPPTPNSRMTSTFTQPTSVGTIVGIIPR